MASVSSTSSRSSATSIYGTRNVITGLASGLDTESMIENAVSAYKTKISTLSQQRTKLSWQQDAYRDIISKMAGFSSKYTSYTSSTNLMSSSFFNQAVRTVTNGANASKVSASGKGTSDVAINRVKQLATAATYKLSGSALLKGSSSKDYASASASKDFDLDKMTVSSFYGTMSLTYGENQSLSFTFNEGDTFDSIDELAANMQKQLESQTISFSGGGGKKASEMLTVAIDRATNTISFNDKAGNKVYISGVSDSMKNAFGVETGEGNTSFKVGDLTREVDTVDYMEANPLSITLDGVTKSIKMPTKEDIIKDLTEQAREGEKEGDREKVEAIGNLIAKLSGSKELTAEERELTDTEKKMRSSTYMNLLQQQIDKSFGTLENGGKKLRVQNISSESGKVRLDFSAEQKGSSFSVKSNVGNSLGFGGTELTSYLNTSKTLKDLLGEEGLKGLETGTDKDGNTTYAFEINGVKIGDFTEKTELSTIMSRINSNKEAGVNVSYSKLTNEFTFTAKETGSAGKIEFSEKGLAGKLFGGKKEVTEGQDAIFTATVDGREMELTRSSNIVDFDGLSVTLKGTFGYKTDSAGNLFHEQLTNDNGLLLFDNEKIFGKQIGDEISIVNASGKAYTYQASDSTNPLNGQRIYGKVDNDGTTKFYVKDQDGEETQVYFRDGWFSVKNENAVGVKAQMNEKAVVDSSAEAVTFTTSTDSDKIVEAVKSFVNDYNEMVTQIKNAYSTLPVQRSSGAYYEPLTDDDRADMSENAIKEWEDKAKTGLLFGDRDLSSLYSRLTSAISMYGQDGADLKAAGITVSYSGGLSTMSFDENTLRDTLDSDPDRVRDIFTKSTENGAATNGLVAAIKAPLEVFGGTTGATKGTLVEKAGSPLAPTTIYSNYIQKQLDQLDAQIEKWQDKMSDQVDYYTTQFSKLEQLISQMNSQSSTLAQLMGGY